MGDLLVSREKETSMLADFLDSGVAEFLALYGRRRVGKTFLIRYFFQDKPVIFFNVTGAKKAPLREQIRHFTQQIAKVFYKNAPLESRKNWDETLEMLTEAMGTIPKDQKIVLFFDEFPWLATHNSRLLENLEYYWNQYWSMDNRLKLIICGSSASWIVRKIINNRAGLHNRITRKIRLEPFKLKETKLFLNSQGIKLNNRQILKIYMVMGGIPYYLLQIKKGLSAAQIIESLAFSQDSFLLDEFQNLFPSLFDDHEIYIKILRIIASYKQGIGQQKLLNKLGSAYDGSVGIGKLRELEESGFIKSFKPHFHKKRGKFYRLIDEYTAFYFTWLEPLKDALQEAALEKGHWSEMQMSPKWHSWLGYAFESVCYKHLSLIRKALNISPTAIASTWRYVPKSGAKENGAQIDLLFDRMDDAISICEMKFSDKPFVIDKNYAKNLLNKKDVFTEKTRTNKQIFITMIAANGIQDNLYADDIVSGVVILEDLFKDV